VSTPSADAFAALARSSPWRWSTLRFAVRRGADEQRLDSVRAWLRRPGRLRVETVDGELLQVVREQQPEAGVLTTDGGDTQRPPWRGPAGAPVLRSDGLVAERPRDTSFDDPMFEDYRWVAMLDPVELADGRDFESGETVGPALLVDVVAEVEHAGRPAWEAVVRPTSVYEPRCACCPLLRTREIDLLEYRDHPDLVLPAYPEAYLARLDLGTGVCVYTAEIGGLTPGAGHDLRIEAVDEPMADDLFVEPRREPFLRRIGWSPLPTPGPGVQ
jgi:hypothetical protein